jgi:hypothetical protein
MREDIRLQNHSLVSLNGEKQEALALLYKCSRKTIAAALAVLCE